MDFPITHLLDPQASDDELVFVLHAEGLRCPNGHDLARCYVRAAHDWARDDDGDGIREVHCNKAEGLWTGLRNLLRTFREINRVYLQ